MAEEKKTGLQKDMSSILGDTSASDKNAEKEKVEQEKPTPEKKQDFPKTLVRFLMIKKKKINQHKNNHQF